MQGCLKGTLEYQEYMGSDVCGYLGCDLLMHMQHTETIKKKHWLTTAGPTGMTRKEKGGGSS